MNIDKDNVLQELKALLSGIEKKAFFIDGNRPGESQWGVLLLRDDNANSGSRVKKHPLENIRNFGICSSGCRTCSQCQLFGVVINRVHLCGVNIGEEETNLTSELWMFLRSASLIGDSGDEKREEIINLIKAFIDKVVTM